jgi:hypothetical protein
MVLYQLLSNQSAAGKNKFRTVRIGNLLAGSEFLTANYEDELSVWLWLYDVPRIARTIYGL